MDLPRHEAVNKRFHADPLWTLRIGFAGVSCRGGSGCVVDFRAPRIGTWLTVYSDAVARIWRIARAISGVNLNWCWR